MNTTNKVYIMENKANGQSSPDDFSGEVITSELYEFMPGSGLLSEEGSQPRRIGSDNKRKANPLVVEVESFIGKMAPLPMTFDVRPIHPPYFREFTYTDTLGGIFVQTMSAEINFRLRKEAAEVDANKAFPIDLFGDKYTLQGATFGGKYKKVLFLIGTNSLDYLDESIVTEIAMDPDWYVKPHPVTTDATISDIITMFGGDRVLNRHLSGHTLLREAEVVATTAGSETLMTAVLLKKEVINVTSKARQHILSYGSFAAVYDAYKKQGATLEELAYRMNNMLASDLSGIMMECYGTRRNKEIAQKYFDAAMELREPWRMETPQRLFVADLYPSHWKGGQPKG